MSDRRPPPTARERREAERRDGDLAPNDRGAVRAFVRDEVDSRRRLVGAFLPVLGIVVIVTGAAWRAGDPAAVRALAGVELHRLGLRLPTDPVASRN